MRQLSAHKANGLNEAINITVLDEPGAGGAHHAYELSGAGKTVRLEFQHGPIKEAGLNGISNEALLAIVADRLECFQAGPFACKDNEDALGMVKGGLTCLLKRTKKRVDQGIEGTNVQHAEPVPEPPAAPSPAPEEPVAPPPDTPAEDPKPVAPAEDPDPAPKSTKPRRSS
jgi:hypothetical protein